MHTERRKRSHQPNLIVTSGFTLTELMVSMAVAGITALALLSTSDYLMNSSLKGNMATEQSKVRNLIQIALHQRSNLCGPERTSSCCLQNLQRWTGTTSVPLSIPGYHAGTGATPSPALTTADNISLALHAGPNVTPFIHDGRVDRALRTEYQLRLVGEFKRRNEMTQVQVYAGAVELTSLRRHITGFKLANFTTRIPIEFELSSTGTLLSCLPRPEGRGLAQGLNTLEDCQKLGGVPVPASNGTLCRFRSAYPPPNILIPCPDGFTGDATTGCVLDESDDAPSIQSVPPCPPGSFVDKDKMKGSFYCNTQGSPGPPPVNAPPCPVDPDPVDPDVTPQPHWMEIPGTYPNPTMTRYCEYYINSCPAGWTQTTDPNDKDPSDGLTPACTTQITSCSSPFYQVPGATPLTCKINLASTVTPSPACPTPFLPVPAGDPDATAWNDATHKVCF